MRAYAGVLSTTTVPYSYYGTILVKLPSSMGSMLQPSSRKTGATRLRPQEKATSEKREEKIIGQVWKLQTSRLHPARAFGHLLFEYCSLEARRIGIILWGQIVRIANSPIRHGPDGCTSSCMMYRQHARGQITVQVGPDAVEPDRSRFQSHPGELQYAQPVRIWMSSRQGTYSFNSVDAVDLQSDLTSLPVLPALVVRSTSPTTLFYGTLGR